MPRMNSGEPLGRLLLAVVVLTALVATSCSKQMPTASEESREHETEYEAYDDDCTAQVVVTLAPGASATAIASDFHATLLEFDCENGLATYRPAPGQSPPELAALLALDPRVLTSEQNGWVLPAESRQKSFAFDDGLGTLQNAVEQPAAEAIGLAQAHRVSTGGNIKVAVLDTGIDPSHPLFRGHIVGSADFLNSANTAAIDMADGVDNDGNNAIDEAYGHGSHVAGIVMLTAPDAQLLVARVLDADGRGDVLAVAAGIRWAVRSGARVINLSLGTLKYSNAIASALEYAEHHNATVVASAGNWGAENPKEYPARASDVIAVAASDAAAQPAPFTSYGDFVALSAPGVAVRSAYPGNSWRLWSGTSMSAPFVTGSVALVLSIHPEWTSETLLARLTSTASPMSGLMPAQVKKLGNGMLNAGAALLPDYDPGAPALRPDADARLRNPR